MANIERFKCFLQSNMVSVATFFFWNKGSKTLPYEDQVSCVLVAGQLFVYFAQQQVFAVATMLVFGEHVA